MARSLDNCCIITLYLLDAQGRVSAERYFTESDDVNEWLSDSGYQQDYLPFRRENDGRPVEASPPDKDDHHIGSDLQIRLPKTER